MASVEGKVFLFQVLVNEYERILKEEFSDIENDLNSLNEVIRRARTLRQKITITIRKFRDSAELQDLLVQCDIVISKLENLKQKQYNGL